MYMCMYIVVLCKVHVHVQYIHILCITMFMMPYFPHTHMHAHTHTHTHTYLPGLNIYSSGSESDSNDDTGERREKGKTGKRNKGSSSKKRASATTSRSPPSAKLPKPEEIAAAFKDSKESEKPSAGFTPLPRIVQEKQRQGKATSSKHLEG